MRSLCFLFILSLWAINDANAQQFNQQENKPQWSGMANPRARRVRSTIPAAETPQRKEAELKPIAQEPKAPIKIQEKFQDAKKTQSALPPLTDGMAERIAQIKGDGLSWADYEMYPYEEDSSGYYIRVHQLNDGMTLVLGGPSKEYEPRYIYITDGNGDVIKALKDY